jgi:hypothetical protein
VTVLYALTTLSYERNRNYPIRVESPKLSLTSTAERGCKYRSQSPSNDWDFLFVFQRPLRIIGGSETKPHQYPWQVGLTYKGAMYCGGSLVTKVGLKLEKYVRLFYMSVEIGQILKSDKAYSALKTSRNRF